MVNFLQYSYLIKACMYFRLLKINVPVNFLFYQSIFFFIYLSILLSFNHFRMVRQSIYNRINHSENNFILKYIGAILCIACRALNSPPSHEFFSFMMFTLGLLRLSKGYIYPRRDRKWVRVPNKS